MFKFAKNWRICVAMTGICVVLLQTTTAQSPPPPPGPTQPGDLNGDGAVNDADAAIWFGDPAAHDANGDGRIDRIDFDIAFGFAQPPPGPTTPPPPGETQPDGPDRLPISGTFINGLFDLVVTDDGPDGGTARITGKLSENGLEAFMTAQFDGERADFVLRRRDAGSGVDGEWRGRDPFGDPGEELIVKVVQSGDNVRGDIFFFGPGELPPVSGPTDPPPGSTDPNPAAEGPVEFVDIEGRTLLVGMPDGNPRVVRVGDIPIELIIHGPPGPDGAPSFEERRPGSLEDINPQEYVVIFGEILDSGEMEARKVEVFKGSDDHHGGPDGHGGPPTAEGPVESVDIEGRTFTVEMPEGGVRRIIVSDTTHFEVITHLPPSPDGEYHEERRPGGLEDLKPGTFVVVFGEEWDNGDVLARKVEVFEGSEGHHGGPGGPLGVWEPVIRQILSEFGGQAYFSETLLPEAPREIIEILYGAAGSDGYLSLKELDRLLGFGVGGFGEPLFDGEVVSIDANARSIDVVLEDDTVQTVKVTDRTELFIRLEGRDPASNNNVGPPPNSFGPGAPAFKSGIVGGTRKLTQFDGSPPDDGSFEGVAFFEDIQPGDFVEVFGEKLQDGTVSAFAIKIIRSFEGEGGFQDFPIAYGQVIFIDTDQKLFEIEEGPGFRHLVYVTDQTDFEILKFSMFFGKTDTREIRSLRKQIISPTDISRPGQSYDHGQFVDPGIGFDDADSDEYDFESPEPELLKATFDDLRIDDDCDVFGAFNDDGSITATRVLLLRGDEPPEPDLIGEVIDIDFTSLLITIEDEDEDTEVIQLTDDTFVGLFHGHFGDEDLFDPESDHNDFDTAFKKTDEFNDPPPGVIFDEFRRLKDIVVGMQVGVFLEEGETNPPIASAVIILNGGQRSRDFEFTGRIDFVDQYGGYIGFRNAFDIYVPSETPITLGNGSRVFTLRELQAALADAQRETWQPRFLKVFTEEGTDPETRTATEIVVIAIGEEPVQSDEYFLARIDDVFGQISPYDNSIWPSPPPGTRFTRNTTFTDIEGNPVDVYDIYEDMRVVVSGVEKIWPGDIGGGERIAESVVVIGGEPFEFDGLVESVDEEAGTFTLEVREPELILSRAFYAGFNGEELPIDDFVRSFEEDIDASQIVIQFNPLGPGIIRLQLHNPEWPRPFRPDEEVFEDFEVSIIEELTDTGEIQRFLVFTQLPDFELADNAVMLDPNGNQIGLSDLVGKGVFFQGEVFVTEEDVRPVVSLVKTYEVVDEIEIVLEIGDFDDEGVDNDVILSVYDIEGNEIAGDLKVFLDFLPPVIVQSGAFSRNIGPGVHRLRVEVPSLDLSAEAEFVIRGRGKGFTVVETVPTDMATNVPEESEIRVTFTSPIQTSGNFVNADVFLRPGFGGEPLGGLRLENDGRTLVIPVKLEANTSYTMAIAQATSTTDQVLSQPLIVTFSTGDELETYGGIEGTLALVEALTKQAKVSDIVFGEIVAVDEQGEKAGKSVIDEVGSFSMRGLPEGEYRLFAKVETTTGATKGAFDANRDGEPDNVEVFADKITDLGVFELPRPLVLREANILQDSESPITVDFDPSRGDNGRDVEIVPPGDTFELAVYVRGVADLVGFELQLNYDSTAVALEDIAEDSEAELNILRSRGGITLSESMPRGGAITQTVSLVGAQETQWGQGDGLLAVLTFTVKERFAGMTDIVVSQAQLIDAEGGSETVQVFTRGQVTVEGLEKRLTLTSSPDSLQADGSDSQILNVQLTDLDGLASFEESSDIHFRISGGGYFVKGLEDTGAAQTTTFVDEQEIIVNTFGEAVVELSAEAEGEIVVTISTIGARDVEVTLFAKGLPPIGEGEVGQVSLDFNGELGDQGIRILERLPDDRIVSLDIVLNEGGAGLSGYQVSVSYDETILSFVSAAPTGIFGSGALIYTVNAGLVKLSTAFLGTATTSDASGSIAALSFKVVEGAELPTRVSVRSAITSAGGSQTRLVLGSGGSEVQIGGATSGPPSPDFDGDGTVGFGDFIAFAGAFGTTAASENWDSKYDLDQDGEVGFTDFITFASLFGTAVKPVLTKTSISSIGNGNAGISLSAIPVEGSNFFDLSVGIENASAVAGYQIGLQYEQSLLEVISVQSTRSSAFSSDDQPALVRSADGHTTIADVLVDPVTGSEDLLQIRFRILDPTQTAFVELNGVEISDAFGRITNLTAVESQDLKQIPNSFELGQNYPNPFNPETVIPFSVPEPGHLTISIFNVLGQEVAMLVDGNVGAGYHRIVWDGTDHYGHDVASGLYFIRMESVAFKSVKKMMYLK